jgi:xanthine dehydrogenase YagS FAD-binding subunit
MKRFEHTNATSVQDAVKLLSVKDARALGGGTDLLGLMKDGLLPTDRVVNLKSIKDLDYIKEDSGELRIGPLARLADIAASALVAQKAPALAQAAAAIASPQIRNTGTLGGNMAQKVRCWYFRDADRADCYKRDGSFCYAVFGASDVHAIFDGAACWAVQPSDTATALSALNANVLVAGPEGEHVVGIDDFYIGPDVDYKRETVLAANEIISGVRVPGGSLGQKSVFIKAAPRRSIDFARASIAVMVTGSPVSSIRITLGGVAPTPHRATEVESFLNGKRLDAGVIQEAATLATKNAKPLGSNAYKVQLVQGLVRKALTQLAS